MVRIPKPVEVAAMCVTVALIMVVVIGLPLAAVTMNAPWPMVLCSTIPFIAVLIVAIGSGE